MSGPNPGPVVSPFTLGPLPSLFDRYKGWMAGQAWYVHLAAVVLATIAGALITKYVPALAPFVPSPADVAKTPPPPAADAQPHLVATAMDGSQLSERQHMIVSDRVRHRLHAALMRDGFALVGGDKTPLTRDQATEKMSKLTDAQVCGAVQMVGGIDQIKAGDGGGRIIEFVQRVLAWMEAHPELVQAILKILMSLMMIA